MFKASYRYKGKDIFVVGPTKSNVKKKLLKLGLGNELVKIKIEECTEKVCPVCGSVLVLDKSGKRLVGSSGVDCFFCGRGGIEI